MIRALSPRSMTRPHIHLRLRHLCQVLCHQMAVQEKAVLVMPVLVMAAVLEVLKMEEEEELVEMEMFATPHSTNRSANRSLHHRVTTHLHGRLRWYRCLLFPAHDERNYSPLLLQHLHLHLGLIQMGDNLTAGNKNSRLRVEARHVAAHEKYGHLVAALAISSSSSRARHLFGTPQLVRRIHVETQHHGGRYGHRLAAWHHPTALMHVPRLNCNRSHIHSLCSPCMLLRMASLPHTPMHRCRRNHLKYTCNHSRNHNTNLSLVYHHHHHMDRSCGGILRTR